MWGFVLHVIGVDNESGRWYAFWSGFGGDLAIVGTLITQPVVYWRHHQCHEKRCVRIGHPVEGEIRCRRHRHG